MDWEAAGKKQLHIVMGNLKMLQICKLKDIVLLLDLKDDPDFIVEYENIIKMSGRK